MLALLRYKIASKIKAILTYLFILLWQVQHCSTLFLYYSELYAYIDDITILVFVTSILLLPITYISQQ